MASSGTLGSSTRGSTGADFLDLGAGVSSTGEIATTGSSPASLRENKNLGKCNWQ
jgi:hypothetical protein